MTEIVAQLRAMSRYELPFDFGIGEVAAREIERLTRELARCRSNRLTLAYAVAYIEERDDWPGTEPLLRDLRKAIGDEEAG